MSAEMKQNPTKFNLIPTKLKLHCFSTEIGQTKYSYQVLKLKESLLIIINIKGQSDFTDLSLSVKHKYDTLPVSTQIMGDFTQDNSKKLANRLTKKLNKSVFVSFNVVADKYTVPLIEKQLFLQIKNMPEMF